MKFCRMVGLPDIVTRAKLHVDRFGHFCVVGVKFQVYPLTLVIVLTTLWHGGHQADAQNSRCGRTKDLYKRTMLSRPLYENVRAVIPSTLLTLE